MSRRLCKRKLESRDDLSYSTIDDGLQPLAALSDISLSVASASPSMAGPSGISSASKKPRPASENKANTEKEIDEDMLFESDHELDVDSSSEEKETENPQVTSKMSTFDDIPLEVQEQIFLHLGASDLKECSFVSVKWHDIINSNQIWHKMCASEGISGKRFLDDSFSLIQNPLKKFHNTSTLGPMCHWRTHFNRYKFIKRNWRTGYFVKSRISFTPIFMNEQYLVQHCKNILFIWEVCGGLHKICAIPLVLPDAKVDNFVSKGDYIAYTQERHVVCVKRAGNEFRVIINVKLESDDNDHLRNHCIKTQLTVRLSEKFLLIQDHLNPCFLLFYDCNQGILSRKIDLHKVLGNQSIFCSCLEVVDDKVFLAYRMTSFPFLVKYDFGKDLWDSPVLLPTEPVELYLSKRFVCVKLSPESRDSPTSVLQVWDHNNSEFSEFYASKHLPVVLTPDDYIIFHSRDEIKIRGLEDNFVKVFPSSRGVMKFTPIWNKYLVILDEKGVSVWDWKEGKKMYTPFRDDCVSTFCVSETNITVRRDNEQYYNLSFW